MIFLWVIREGLGEGYDADIGFVNALESFGGGHNDPICVAFGGTFLFSVYFFSLLVICIVSLCSSSFCSFMDIII